MSIPLSTIVNVGITIAATPTPLRGFGKLVFLTDEVPEDVTFTIAERIRSYADLDSVLDDWATASEVYAAASAFFGQNASNFSVALASATETAATLTGGTAGALVDLQAITAGGFTISIDGTAYQVSGVDLSLAADFDEVAEELEQALQGLGATATVTYNGFSFVITSGTTGAGSNISPAAADINDLALEMGLLATSGAVAVDAQAAETPTEALAKAADVDPTFYGIVLNRKWRDTAAVMDVAQYAQGSQRVFLNTSNDATVLTSATTDIISQLQAATFSRTLSHYSSTPTEYPSAAVAGRAFIVNFEGVDTTITLFLKQLNGVTAEALTLTQKNTLESKNGNAVITVGSANVYSDSRMANGTWFDTIHGVDWLQNRIETDVFNRLFSTSTKVPYNDTGISIIYQAVEGALRQGVTNGLISPGNTSDGTYLPLGYEISYVPTSNVSPADKGNRHYAGMSFKAVGAGAIHGVTITGEFNE
ncbi:tail sheath protein [Vibrio phage vB_VpaM_VPs20]|uniref:Tail sheath protein n=1 Tax=Vibrio phage vB_VpaM_VPs20 TaxID=2978980 RepID=A0A9X9NZS7_9CAUD|nr:tail sheath protein [Vibrio phage vB_VpaM_VPs20]UYD72121.1 tail sheath protein [Vibrio phage vB_VpaM_VPs20]